MGAVKIREADRLFSRCVRERAGWQCEKCGTQHEEGSRGLECSHFHGRGKWSPRFDPDNCFSICTACHFRLVGNPVEHVCKGDGFMQILTERANDLSLGRMAKRSEKEIRAHYRAELARMKELRAQGGPHRVRELVLTSRVKTGETKRGWLNVTD